MKLYHGTNIDFEKIDIAKSKPNKDFGRGFYLSADYKQAQNMANIKFEQMETGKPLVQEYSIDEQEMQNLKILVFDDYTEEWAKFILLNRNNPSATPAHNYDIVIGPIANDRVGVQLWKYENRLTYVGQEAKIHEGNYYSILLRNRTCHSIIEKSMNEISEMKADMVKHLAILLMNHNKDLKINEALAIIFNSDTYQKLMNDSTGLYYQSPRYVFSFLNSEIKNGKIC